MKKKVILILIALLLSLLITGCADDNKTTSTVDTVDNSAAEEADTKYTLGANEQLLFADENYFYVVQTDEIVDEDKLDGAWNETLSYIYKIDIDGSNKKMIIKEPVRDWIFYYETTTENWLYLSIIEWVPYSEYYPMGIARIDRNNDKFEMVASPFADGLAVKDDIGYFFWNDQSIENESDSNVGIYQLDLESGDYKRLGPLPVMYASPIYDSGKINEVKDGKIYFEWFGEEGSENYILDIESGTIER